MTAPIETHPTGPTADAIRHLCAHTPLGQYATEDAYALTLTPPAHRLSPGEQALWEVCSSIAGWDGLLAHVRLTDAACRRAVVEALGIAWGVSAE